MRLRTTLAVSAASLVVVGGLVALIVPVILPVLPTQAQVMLGGTLETNPGTLDELFRGAGLGEHGDYGDTTVSHADVDAEYEHAASVWPWALPPDWGFAKHRGVADTPGRHVNGMGVQAAFSMWATASLDAVKSGRLEPEAASALLDELEAATRILLDERVLSDAGFIEDAITPLR